MRKLLTISACLILALSACIPTFGQVTEAVDPANAVQTAVAGTKIVEEAVAAAVAQTAAAQQPPPEAATEPPPAATTEPPPPTEPPAITATLNANANCRSGPAGSFEFIVLLHAGDSGDIIGKNTEFDTPWYQLALPDGKQCWVTANVLDIGGDTSGVQEIKSPPTPTPLPPAALWAGKWTVWQNQCYDNDISCEDMLTITYTMTGSNTITASYFSGQLGCNLSDSLTISSDGTRADGISKGCGGNWEVHLTMDPNKNQFRGRWNEVGYGQWDGYYCGARNGASKPNPTR